MFWDDGAAALNSLQKLLLDTKGDVELYRVLEDEYVLQESRQGNQELMAVLTKDENLIELTKYCLRPVVDLRLPVEERYKLSYLSTEILTVAGHNYIAEAFLKNQTCLEILGSVLDDPSAFNPVVAIFYAKLMSSLWSKNFAATMAFVKETHFLQKSLDFVRFGAIADLLESLIRLNSDEANIVTIKQYLVTEQFIPKIVALLNPDHEPAMHENAADVYVDILRNLREVLAVTDEKADVLHEVFLSETLIKDILDRMFWKDESINQQQRASLVRNGYAMISALCEQNALSPTPSQLFDAGEPEQQNSWNGGGPGESNQVFDRTKIWLPDQEKVAEIQAAKRAADIVRAIIVDMDQAETGNSWPWLLKLLNELVDTNHLPTHQLLVEGFREANFKKLFDLVYKHPLVHIYHHHVRNIVTFALFSDFSKTAGSEELSPLVDLFIKECDLFAILKNGVWPIPTIPRMTSISIRSFHIYLADSFIKAAKWAPCRRAITELVEKSEEWTGEDELSIEKGLDVYWETNRSDLLQMMKIHSPDEPSSTAGNQYSENTVYDIETFSRFECGQEYSDFDPATNLNSILHHFTSKSPDPEDEDIDLRSHDAREGDFDQVDQFRPLADLFPPLEPRTVKIIRRSEVEESTTPQVTPTAMDTSSEEPAVADEWDAFATGRLSNGSNSSADEWGSLPTTTSSTAVDEPARPQRGSFDGMDFDQHCKEAMDCLDASVKSEEKTTDPVWDNDTLTSDQWNPFPDSQQQQLPASPAVCRHETEEETPSVQELNESEA